MIDNCQIRLIIRDTDDKQPMELIFSWNKSMKIIEAKLAILHEHWVEEGRYYNIDGLVNYSFEDLLNQIPKIIEYIKKQRAIENEPTTNTITNSN